jgi:hypothetical protein
VLDNSSTHKAPKIRRWLAAHPPFHLYFTPSSSSWLNMDATPKLFERRLVNVGMGLRRLKTGPVRLAPLVVGLLAFAAVLLGIADGTRAKDTSRAGPVVLHAVFHRAGTAGGVAANSRYVFVQAPQTAPAGELGTLTDAQTGRRIPLVRKGCRNTGASSAPRAFAPQPRIGGPWLVFNCTPTTSPAPVLYSLAPRSWRAIAPNSRLLNPCQGVPTECDITFTPSDAGSHWLQYTEANCPAGEHCIFSHAFQSLDTGQIRSDPTSASTIADLNSRALARRVCPPLEVPRAFQGYGGWGRGTLTMDGSFAIAQGTDANLNPTVYLERCGSRLHQLLTTGPYPDFPPPWAANTSAVIWWSGPRHLTGVFLPSLHRFSVAMPQQVVSSSCSASDVTSCVQALALSDRTLYVLNADGQLWTANSPTASPDHP